MRNLTLLALITCYLASFSIAEEAGLSDPTRPNGFSEKPGGNEISSEKLSLTLIRLGPEPVAVINGKTVAPGESIAGYRLLSLQTTSAALTGFNGRVVLHLAPTIRKSSSTISSQNR